MSEDPKQTAWVVVNKEGQIWTPKKARSRSFSNTGKMFKSMKEARSDEFSSTGSSASGIVTRPGNFLISPFKKF